MGWEAVVVLALVVAVFVAFFLERYPPEVVALGASALLLALGILDTSEFLSVFSNGAPITIAMMFIISAALERTGVLQWLGGALQRGARQSELKSMVLIMVTALLASAFMNNTPVVLLLTPVVISLAGGLGISASRFLIPLSFAAIFGGTLTLIGTSTNILMSSVATAGGLPPIGMFQITLPGLVFAGAGMAYMLVLGRRLLPDRVSLASLLASQPKRQFIAEVLVTRASRLVGRRPWEITFGGEPARVLDVIRAQVSWRGRLEELRLQAGDRIVLETNAGELVGLREDGQIEFKSSSSDFDPVSADRTVTMEASVGLRSSLIGRTLSELNLRRLYGVYVLAVHRQDENLTSPLDRLQLGFADTLLIEGPAAGIRRLLETGEVINLSQPQERPVRRSKAPVAIATIAAVMGLAALDVMPIAGLAVIGAVVVMVSGCIDPEEAFNAIGWRILFLIFGMLGLSMGLAKTGAAQWIVDGVVGTVEHIGPLGLLAAVYVLTSFLTELVSNNAVALLVGPLVIPLAQQSGLDPLPFVMAVMFAASASFATPVGYHTNTFIYTAGGYRFGDFVRVGLPLNVLFALLAVWVLPAFFPF